LITYQQEIVEGTFSHALYIILQQKMADRQAFFVFIVTLTRETENCRLVVWFVFNGTSNTNRL